MVDGRELGTGLRGRRPAGLDRQLRATALGPCALDFPGGGVQSGASPARDCLEALSLCHRPRALGLQRVDLVRETRLAVGLEAPDLALERANPVGRLERIPSGRRGPILECVLRRARQPLVG